MIVMHHRQPTIRFPSAISHPKNTIQIRFTRNENIPFPYTTSFPKGQNARVANLKHCKPTGIPIIVIHQMHPAKTHASPPSKPPNINQRIFPKVLIKSFLSQYLNSLPSTFFIIRSVRNLSKELWQVPKLYLTEKAQNKSSNYNHDRHMPHKIWLLQITH